MNWTPGTPKVRLMNVSYLCRLPSLLSNYYKLHLSVLYMAYVETYSQSILEFPIGQGDLKQIFCHHQMQGFGQDWNIPLIFLSLSAYLCHQQDWEDEVQGLRSNALFYISSSLSTFFSNKVIFVSYSRNSQLLYYFVKMCHVFQK